MALKYNIYRAFYDIKMHRDDQLTLYLSKTTEELFGLLLSENAGVVFKSLCVLTHRELDDKAFNKLIEVNNNGKTFKNRKLANNILRQLFPEQSSKLRPGESKQTGYVYFIEDELSGFIKIGRTKNLEERVKFFTKRLSFPIKLIQHIKTINYEKIELAFHQHYKKMRLRGEWFKLNNEEIGRIKQKVFPQEIELLIVED